jgi:glycosyltransferase involved in cell wall biosynthesis
MTTAMNQKNQANPDQTLPSMVDTKKLGVNFFGPSETADGIGRAALLNLQCLSDTDFSIEKYVLSRPVALEKTRQLIITDSLVRSLPYKINYFHFSARWVPHYFAQLSAGALDGFHNIGYWVCEVPEIPEQWAKQFRFFDEIWTSSAFCQQAMSRSSNVPILLMPHPIEEFPMTERMKQRRAGVDCGVFTFLSIANVYSDAERKNILFTIRAFLNAFGDRQDVKLIVKTSNLEYDPLLEGKLKSIKEKHRNVEVVPGYVENDVIHGLYSQADAYVSLHRAEGFGLTISDAISRGIPVIATGYSGNADFCDGADTMLVDYALREIGHERLRYRKHDAWAELEMGSATRSFAEMVESYRERLTLADRARTRVQRDFSIRSVSSLMQARLALIDRQFSFENDLDGRILDREVGINETYGF